MFNTVHAIYNTDKNLSQIKELDHYNNNEVGRQVVAHHVRLGVGLPTCGGLLNQWLAYATTHILSV